MKNRADYDLIVTQNFRHPATIFENTVFIIDIIVFTGFTVLAIFVGQWKNVWTYEILLFALAGGICLYCNNCFSLKMISDRIFVRRFFSTKEYNLADCSSYYRASSGHYIFVFTDGKIKIPINYKNLSLFLERVRQRNNPFRTEEGKAWLKEYIKNKTAVKTISLVPDITEDLVSARKIDLCTTKLGGFPYWDFSKEFPTDENGEKMQLLFQLNFEELAEQTDKAGKNELFPENGLLQFFISASEVSDTYGMNYEDPVTQKNFRIVYHPSVDKAVTTDDVIKHGVIKGSDNFCTPVIKTCTFKFTDTVSFMNETDWRFESLIHDAVKEYTGKDFEGSTLSDLICDVIENFNASEIYRTIDSDIGHLLGYSAFTQEDPRCCMTEENASYYDTNLLLLDSCMDDMNIMMWRYCGIASFMINSEDLKNLDFSKVFYSWDCC